VPRRAEPAHVPQARASTGVADHSPATACSPSVPALLTSPEPVTEEATVTQREGNNGVTASNRDLAKRAQAIAKGAHGMERKAAEHRRGGAEHHLDRWLCPVRAG
jgi:hypothetical protein